MRRATLTSVTLTALAASAAFLYSGCCDTPKCPTAPRPVVEVPPPQPQPPDRRLSVSRRGNKAWPYSCERGLEIIRRQVDAHIHLSELLGWHTRTRGEKPMQKVLFVGKEQLVSRRTLAFINHCLPKQTDPQDRKAAEFLRDYLAMAYIERQTAAESDSLAAAEIGAAVTLSFQKGPVGYSDLPVLLSREKDPKRRTEISEALSKVQRTVLNPLHMKKLMRAQELAQWMGYSSYVALSEQARRVDLPALLRQGSDFMQKSEPIYQSLLGEVAKENGVLPGKLRRADHARIFRAAQVERHLPEVLMVPAFRHFLRGIGLDMKTATGADILVDDEMHPKKNPRAACFPLDPPTDVRITVKPVGGLVSWTTFFHEGGHALHFAWVTTPRPEFKQLGSYGFTEAVAELFARVWEEPAWLERYATFAREVSGGKHADLLPKGARVRGVPALTKPLMAYVIRNRLAYNLYLARRYGWAKLIYETVLQGGPEAYLKGIYAGQTSNRKALYRELFGKAYGYPLDEADAEQYLADVDAFFYAADYARAFLLADLLHEVLREKFGAAWFTNPQVGAFLKGLFAHGNRDGAEEVARQLGHALDYQATLSRLTRLRAAADALAGKRAAKAAGAAPCKPVEAKAGKCKVEY